VHHYGSGSVRSCPCTALASHGDERVATVGEDGCLVILALETARSRSDMVYRLGRAHPHTLYLSICLSVVVIINNIIIIIIN